MAGQLGNKYATTQSQKVVKIDTDRALLYIKGNVPGPISGLVRIKDAWRKIDKQVYDLLYPTFVPGHEEHAEFSAKDQIWKGDEVDPYEVDWHENDVVSGVDQDEEQ